MSPSKRIQKILCPIDFSEFSKITLEEALDLAEGLGAELTVLNVINERRFEDLERMLERYPQHHGNLEITLAQAVQFLEDERAEAMKNILEETGAHRVPHTSRITKGVPYERILEIAAADHMDLIVMGDKGGGSVMRQLRFGSNAEKVFRRAKTRVLFIK